MSCTYDYCDFSTGYECAHNKIPDCCGDGICERDECLECLSDCYTCKGQSCRSEYCGDESLSVFSPSGTIRIEVPTAYLAEAVWFGEIQLNTLRTIESVYGYGPTPPLVYRFWEHDNQGMHYSPHSNMVIMPASSSTSGELSLEHYYRDANNRSLLEIHETAHAINAAQCELLEVDSTGRTVRGSKMPLWTDEALAMMMELWIPHQYGNPADERMSIFEPERASIIENYEDKESSYWELVRDPDAYGYEHARGTALLYLWAKHDVSEEQVRRFVDGTFRACQHSDQRLTSQDIVELWNTATGRQDTAVFRDVGILEGTPV
jgi:hypothetical protein